MAYKISILHSEIIIYLKSEKGNTGYAFFYNIPIINDYQYPLRIIVNKEKNSKILGYKIITEFGENKLIKFDIGKTIKNEIVKIHFEFIVLIVNKNYDDLSKNVSKNSYINNNEHREWLSSSKSIQSNNIIIKLISYILSYKKVNMIDVINRIIVLTPFHNIHLQFLRYIIETNRALRPIFLPKKYFTGLMDSMSYLFWGGLCCAQTNFAVSLLRANRIPTRVMIVTMFGRHISKGEKIWLDSNHYMLQVFIPKYGWVNGTPGKFPYNNKNYIIHKILYIRDENIAGNGLSFYGGMSPWFHLSKKDVAIQFPNESQMPYKKPFGNISGVPAIRLWVDSKFNINKKSLEILTKLIKKNWHINIEIINQLDNSSKSYKNCNYFDIQKELIYHLKKGNVKKAIDIYKNVFQIYTEKLL